MQSTNALPLFFLLIIVWNPVILAQVITCKAEPNCIPDSSPCKQSVECNGDSYCGINTTNNNTKVCLPKKPEGAACEVQEACVSFGANGPVKCSNGMCATESVYYDGALNSACSGEHQCAGGSICYTGLCITLPTLGQACDQTTNFNCYGAKCNQQLKKCMPYFSQQLGELCEDHYDCDTSLICVSATCIKPVVSSNKHCNRSSDCEAGEECSCLGKEQPECSALNNVPKKLAESIINYSSCVVKHNCPGSDASSPYSCPACRTEYCDKKQYEDLEPITKVPKCKYSYFFSEFCTPPNEQANNNNSNPHVLAIALPIVFVFLLGGVAMVGFVIWRRRTQKANKKLWGEYQLASASEI